MSFHGLLGTRAASCTCEPDSDAKLARVLVLGLLGTSHCRSEWSCDVPSVSFGVGGLVDGGTRCLAASIVASPVA